MIPLPQVDVNSILQHLTVSATVGGWFFLALAGFLLVVLLLVHAGLIKRSNALKKSPLIGLLTLEIVLLSIGLWLLDYQRRLRPLIAQAQKCHQAKLIEKRGPSVNGWFVQFQIEASPGVVRYGEQRFLGEPAWDIDETLVVCLLPDGEHFFPQDLNQHADVGEMVSLSP